MSGAPQDPRSHSLRVASNLADDFFIITDLSNGRHGYELLVTETALEVAVPVGDDVTVQEVDTDTPKMATLL